MTRICKHCGGENGIGISPQMRFWLKQWYICQDRAGQYYIKLKPYTERDRILRERLGLPSDAPAPFKGGASDNDAKR